MAGLALVTPRIAVQGGHGLAVKTMFRFNPISPNKDECVGCLGYGRVLLRWASLAKAQRLVCVDEVPLRGFPRVNPVLLFKA